LQEKSIDHQLTECNLWDKSNKIFTADVALELPILIKDKILVADVGAISEYLEETYYLHPLIGASPLARIDVRRIANWFNTKFYAEVTQLILHEKIVSYFTKTKEPSSSLIRVAKQNIYPHLDYMTHWIKQRKWLAAEKLTLADIAAASQLSVLDYLGDVPWDYSHHVREWYAIIKSRPSFRAILNDYIPGFNPSNHYANLDF
jgi:glutathione S-transferase